jgi:hypothetical protein
VYPLDPPRYRTPPCRAGLPAIVVANESGPPAHVRPLRRLVRAVGESLAGWHPLPAPPVHFSACSAVSSRSDERARVEWLYARGRDETVDVVAAELVSDAAMAGATAKLGSSFACFTAAARRELRQIDPSASIRVAPLPEALRRLSPRLVGRRTFLASPSLRQRSVRDFVFVVEPRRRLIVALYFAAQKGLPLRLEARVVSTALRWSVKR